MRRALAIAVVAGLAAMAAPAQVILPPNLGAPNAAPNVPGPGYDLALAALAAGDYSAALELAEREYRGSTQIGADRWIDSIATATVLGECQFELGKPRDALARYEEALAISAANANWLLAVRFPPAVLAPMRRPPAAAWGRSKRNAAPAAIPDTMTIRQQGNDAQDVLQKGGVLTAPHERPIRPQEIIRSLVIALYRSGSLLGELGHESPVLDQAARALARRPAPPNHYSQSWIDIALGTATWAQGKAAQAQPLLMRGLLVGNQLDHPLTAWGLIVLGRIALDADRAAEAATYFEEATFSAANYGDARALEEAFQGLWVAHRLKGERGVAAPIKLAADATRSGPKALHERLLAMQAESLAAAGDPRSAAAALRAIDGRLLKSEAGQGTLGSIAGYAAALVAYAGGDIATGDGELERSLGIARGRSQRLFQTDLLVELVQAGSSSVSERQAEELFQKLLADPAPRDFAADPLDALAVTSSGRITAYDTWVALAARRGNEQALEAAEATMRHRWMAARPLGGRRLAVERFLAADPRFLEADERARRLAVVADQQGLEPLLVRIGQLRGNLGAAVAAAREPAADAPAPAGDAAEWQEYAAASLRLRQVAASLAAGRVGVPAFPPLTPTAEIRRRLEPGQALLSFHWTASGLFAALENRDRLLAWQVKQAGGLPGEIRALAKELSLHERSAAVGTDRLLAGDWEGSAARIERMLFENSRGVSLADGIEELVIVPDGWLWYVPFEILPVASNQAGEDRRPLREVCRIRYAPTRSLAVLRFAPRDGGTTGLLLGRMAKGEKREAAAANAEAMLAGTEGGAVLEPSAGGPTADLLGSLFDTLVVYDELAAAEPGAPWPLFSASGGRPATTFGDWLAAPPKRPRQVVLPGVQTAMATGLAKPPPRPGEDLFLPAVDLIAAGGRTALLSRWRSGGPIGESLVREFLRETAGRGGVTAAEAWQRAVDLVTPERPDPEREPRIKQAGEEILEDATHPVFWAGHVLIDCGRGVYEDAPAAGQPPAPPLAPVAPPAPGGAIQPQPAKPAAPAAGEGPMPPAILPPPPPRAEP
ncbi:MAG: tetratricopeptide repeat protein [Planctomycetota bacterium]